jgi:glycosyltransferase involved in cell wall biosynthesis
MKICYCSSSKIISDSANSVHVMHMSASMSKLGHDVTLYGIKGNGPHSDLHNYYGTSQPFKVVRLKEEQNWLIRALRSIQKKNKFIKLGQFPSILYGKIEFKEIVKNQEFKLIYARNINWLYSVRGVAKYIVESHGPPQNFIDRYIEKVLFKHSNFLGLVVISKNLKNLYLAQFPQLKGRIYVAHDAANDPFEGASLMAPIKNVSKKLVVGYVGHLYEGRGINLIIELAKQFTSIDFEIVGGTEKLVSFYRRKNKSSNLTFHGQVPHSEVHNFYKKFDVVLAPYQHKVSVSGNFGNTAEYMSPLKIFEYMSHGKCIICSNLPVLKEVLNNKNSFLVSPNIVEEWARVLKQILQNPDIGRKRGLQARRTFISKYSWDKRTRDILAHFFIKD